jgi:oligopeptide/dipeptide ABC transporter ATP-binding protein
MTGDTPLVDVRDLTVEFRQGRRLPPLKAVNDVSLQIWPGETVGLVGESGSGKSTIGNAVLGLVPVSTGAIFFEGTDITHAPYRVRRALSAHLQAVFQNPYSSLNPVRTIGQTLAEPLGVHRKLSKADTAGEVGRMLQRVGLSPDAAYRYPAQFSGGQRQRVAIARALMLSPRVVICDEAVSALDLSVQAQVLNLLRDLQEELGLSHLFISHDLAVVRNVSHRIIVLYRGQIMEAGPASQVSESPGHPYTRALLAAAPVPDPELQARRRVERGARMHANGHRQPTTTGCPFVPRCPYAIDICATQRPPVVAGPAEVTVACHRYPDVTNTWTGTSAGPLTSPHVDDHREGDYHGR